ncbi:MAG: GAF domain-containing protein [Cyanothece sp. SIO1E1]|nr:GAF domain-containing protein [Cyanothece sp. SIO1E1]
MLTGHGDYKVDIEAMQAGAADYLEKGQLDARLLERAIRHAIERQQVEAKLQRQSLRTQLLAEVTRKIRQSLQLKGILRTTVREIQTVLACDRVLIAQIHADGSGTLVEEAVLANWPTMQNQEINDPLLQAEYLDNYRQGQILAIADLNQAILPSATTQLLTQFAIRAKLVVPILIQHRLWGLLITHQCDHPRQWDAFEIELLQQLADQIGIAISQSQLLENLEELVAARTTELTATNQRLQQEIQERRQVEAALRQSEEQLRLTTDALPVLIAYVDHQQHYRFNNQAHEDWYGKPSLEIHGRHIRAVWGEAFYQKIQHYVEAALSGQKVTYETQMSYRDTQTRDVSVTHIPHFGEAESIKGFFTLVSDISDRKAIERMKDEFISVVSHELRTPLTSIHGSLKLLATGRLGSLSPEGQQMLAIADENTDRLVRLVNDVLDLQRIESGQVKMAQQVCDAADLITRAAEAMQSMAQQHQVTLATAPVSIALKADPDYIVQTLTNLLSNAIKFSRPGDMVGLIAEPWRGEQRSQGVEEQGSRGAEEQGSPSSIIDQQSKVQDLSFEDAARWPGLSLRDSQSQELTKPSLPPYIRFQIRDQGQGIPADKLEAIFERFHQVDASDSRKKGGTGLGLSICRKIVEQHGGEIWVESTFGEGSTFYFTLPTLQ